MGCHAARGVRRLLHAHAGFGRGLLGALGCPAAAAPGLQVGDGRLYHRAAPVPASRLRLLGSPVLSRPPSCPCPCTRQLQQSRTIIISKIIEVLREAKLTSFEDALQSAPVLAAKHLYEWAEASTGLPWAADIILVSTGLQLLFGVPAYVYLARWTAGKEKMEADMVAIRAPVIRAPTRAGIKMITEANKDLSIVYGCERYKLYTTIAFQIVHFLITSMGVRALISDPTLDVASAVLPWGALLGVPGFVFPFVNASLNLLLCEVEAWKKLRSQEGLAMTFKRASLPFKPEPLYLLNLKRACSLSFIMIYAIVPSAMTLHWFVLASTSINVQLLLTHKTTRRALGISSSHYETDKPYKDFLYYLRNELSVRHRKVIKMN